MLYPDNYLIAYWVNQHGIVFTNVIQVSFLYITFSLTKFNVILILNAKLIGGKEDHNDLSIRLISSVFVG